ncbi:TPA: hypothetical protein DEO28_01025 [Candidatus Dependentiae bacterium]|nr:MAG: hypothetical protein UR14_C0003G0057 [candidate division TM6 bacterium GW2011_GWE2_31_21]KKP53779.1 MAG: hypothetical protein UR43_C0003G0100 [candidate division TM6 bacterium GW2011_GWF2_33_332]HBS48467.1 hypothetical protein [Candidatus Dependentiae bacterium]HBZ73082.1 hypothetical protein [Candidatus Dependentiae bacterium]
MKRKILLLLMLVGAYFCKPLKADVIIDGEGNYLNLSVTSSLYVSEAESLILQNIVVNNLQGTTNTNSRLVMEGLGSDLQLRDAVVNLSGDYSLTTGSLEFKEKAYLQGIGKVFRFSSPVTSTIDAYSTLYFDQGITISFTPDFGGIYFTDATSKIQNLDDSNLATLITLTLSGGVNLTLYDDYVELPAADTLWIIGTTNTIKVENTFVIYGTLSFTDSAELIFEFDDQGENPIIYFNNSSQTLPDNAHLMFKGNGTVVFQDGFQIIFSSTGGNARPKFELSGNASMKLGPSLSTPNPTISKVYFKNKGIIAVDDGAEILAENNRHLFIGGNGSTTDDFNILIDREGSLKSIGRYGTISMYKATLNLDFEQGGVLMAFDNGAVEINALNGAVSTGGNLQNLKFDTDGLMNIRTNGNFILGENLSSDSQITTSINFSTQGGDVYGDGTLQFAGQSAFRGKLLGVGRIFEGTLSAEEIVRRIVNQSSVLNQSAQFEDQSGTQRLRIKNSFFRHISPSSIAITGYSGAAPMRVGDIISGESANDVSGKNTVTNRSFKYDLSGRRSDY